MVFEEKTSTRIYARKVGLSRKVEAGTVEVGLKLEQPRKTPSDVAISRVLAPLHNFSQLVCALFDDALSLAQYFGTAKHNYSRDRAPSG